MSIRRADLVDDWDTARAQLAAATAQREAATDPAARVRWDARVQALTDEVADLDRQIGQTR